MNDRRDPAFYQAEARRLRIKAATTQEARLRESYADKACARRSFLRIWVW